MDEQNRPADAVGQSSDPGPAPDPVRAPDAPAHDPRPVAEDAVPGPQGPPPAWRPHPAGPPVPPMTLPMAPPPQQGSFKRGFGLGAGAGLGFGGMVLLLSLVGTLLTGLIMAAIGAAAGGFAGAGQISLEQMKTVWGADTASKKLRAIPVHGAIQTRSGDGLALTEGTFGYEVADVLDDLTAADADGVVLLMDTPGGTVTGSQAIGDAIDRYRERTGKKVFAFVEGMSASGGMWTMASADEIVSDHGGIIGSIGVIMGPIERYRDVTGAGSLLTGQVTAGEITSEYITAGTGKDAGTPYRDMTPEERASFQALLNPMYDAFVSRVSSKRGISADTIVNELGAHLYVDTVAKEKGLIDDVMGRDEAMRHFATVAGLDPNDTKLVQSSGPGMWSSLFGVEQRPWGVAPAAVSVGGQPPRATARLCTDPTTPLAWHGTMVGVCR